MLKYHLKFFIRNLIRQKFIAFINIFGLAVGICTAILITAFISHELNYDKAYKNSDRVFRLIRNWQGSEKFQADVPPPLAEVLQDEIHEIESFTRLYWLDNRVVVAPQDKTFREDMIFIVDSTFFRVFGIDLIKGDEKEALRLPQSAVISTSAARKYFNEKDPIGQTLEFEGRGFNSDNKTFLVTGVFEDFPSTSHLKSDILLSLSTAPALVNTDRRNHSIHTYLLLKDQNKRRDIEDRLPSVMENYYGKEYYDYSRSTYLLQPIMDIHLDTMVYYGGYETPKGSYANLYIYPLLAIFILLISSINFINLSICQSIGRRKEVCIKKLTGSGSLQQAVIFIFESVFLCLLALMLALILTELIFPYFIQLAQRSINIDEFLNNTRLLWITLTTILLGILSGLYPAIRFSMAKPINVLYKRNINRISGTFFNSKLVVLQFTVCIFLLIGSIVIYRQFQFIQQKTQNGFDKDNVLILKNPWYLEKNKQVFLNELREQSIITDVSLAGTIPGNGRFSTWGHPVDSAGIDSHIAVFFCDYDYLNTLKIEITEGRFFSRSYSTDSLGIVLNEAAVKKLGWEEDPIGKRYTLGSTYSVIGVVKDFHFESLHDQINPMGMILGVGEERYILARIKDGNSENAVKYITNTWDRLVPDRAIEFSFLKSEYDFWYKTEKKTGIVVSVFTSIGIFISCLGLLGLVIFSTFNRTKEIGIRKINGASIGDILQMLNKDFLKWVTFAFIIACPLSWYAMSKWLENFAYKTMLNWWIFVMAGMFAIVIASITVSFHTWKAAIKNPIESLRYE